jgi:hypothetical protein
VASRLALCKAYDSGSMAADEHGRVWIDGMTAATDLPTRNAFQSSYGGGYLDGFLAALSSDGSKLCYGTYVGSSGQDLLEGIAVGNCKVYASGISASKNLLQKNWRVQSDSAAGDSTQL